MAKVTSKRQRLELFDAATKRQRARQRRGAGRKETASDRGWTREELYPPGRGA